MQGKLFSKTIDCEGMDAWPDRLKLYAILATTKSLLETVSEQDGFSGECPKSAVRVIDEAIAFFNKPEENKYPEDLSLQFAPTGPIQEISISNGWDKVFLKLSEQFDKYASCLKEKI
jgi:hypothetical protein